MLNKLFPFYFIILFSLGCAKDIEPEIPSIGFKTLEGIGSEGDGNHSIELKTSTPVSETIELNYEFTGRATLNGDFKLLTPTPITIRKGESTASIELSIIDDEVYENYQIKDWQPVSILGKKVEFVLKSVSGNAAINENAKKFTFEISDNDQLPSKGLKNDLTWSVFNSDDIDDVNLNLYALYDVVISNNTITSAQIYNDVGINESGYETITIDENAIDSEYYIAIEYLEGNGTADFMFLSYLPSGPLYGIESFPEPNQGEEFRIYGPIFSKSGTNFSKLRNTAPQPMLRTNLKISSELIKALQ